MFRHFLILTLATPLLAVDFTRDVRPILSRHCFKCHGPDDKTRKGELRLDLRDAALAPAESGAAAVVPGKVDASELVKRILATDADDIMPPPAAKLELSAQQKETLKQWIASGAEYTLHWSFTAPKPAAPPADAAHPIDGFILKKLAEAGLRPSPEADAAALCRRLYLDLIGLPPTPEETVAFEKASAASRQGAVEQLTDKLLASPQYGERWARKWLDLARYADTNGYEKDRDRTIWPYRDWVIGALNADMPFDRFTIEQLAGDMLPGATREQITATGFHRNTMLNEEGGIDPLEFRFHAMVDRVATTGTTWLGLTLGCAQCHTHKYDPIPHREYYQMMAFLDNAEEPELELTPPDAIPKQAAYNTEATRLAALLADKLPMPRGPLPPSRAFAEMTFAAWLAQERPRTAAWSALRPVEAKSNLPLLTIENDASIYASGDFTKHDTYELKFRDIPAGATALRFEALPDPRLPRHGPGMAYYEGPKGDFFLGELTLAADGQQVKFARAGHSYASNNFGKNPIGAKYTTDGDVQTGWGCSDRPGERHTMVLTFPAPMPTAKEWTLKLVMGRHYAASLGRFRVSVTKDSAAAARDLTAETESLLAIPDAKLSPAQRAQLRENFLLSLPALDVAAREIRDLRKPQRATATLVLRERPAANPRATHIHNRGEFLQPTERVAPGVLTALNPLPKGAAPDRLAFARWLVSAENPLTARVTVNRAWAAFFGRGIVKTTDDFGLQGEAPSHPELLDWLALDFIRGGWSMKQLHKRIVTSATYRQAARVTPQALAKDPENRLLSHFPRLRLEAEILRDAALRGSGLLSMKLGGPSVRPPQPASVTEVAYGGQKWTASTGEDRYRRSLYTFSKRTAPFALYNTFDAPTGEACVARRDLSNTPLQALALMNDEVFLEAAQALGKTIAALPGTDDERARALFRRTLGREPGKEQLALLMAFQATQMARFATKDLDGAKVNGDPKAPDPERAAWTVTARALFNLDEWVTKP